MPIKLVAFDIGGVLASIDKAPVLDFKLNIFDHDFDRLQIGDIDPHMFLEKKSHKLGVNINHLAKSWSAMIKINQETNILNFLKINYFFMSNINQLHYDSFISQISPTNFARENSCLSFELKTTKPNKLFFIKVISKINISPSNILFIDDKINNIICANLFGFQAVQINQENNLNNILKNYLVI